MKHGVLYKLLGPNIDKCAKLFETLMLDFASSEFKRLKKKY